MPPRKKRVPPSDHPKPPRDAPGRRHIEEELRASEARLRSLLDNLPDLILEIDREGVIRYANRLPEGDEGTDLVGRRVTDLVLPEQRDAVQATFDRAWRSGRPADLEIQAPDAQGRITWWWARVAPVTEEGRTTSLLVATRDVTRRKLAGLTRLSVERRLRDLLDTIRLLAVIVDAEERVSYANDAFLSLTGWRAEEIVGAPWLERCVPADTREFVAPLLARMRRSASVPARFEHAIVTRDGRRRLIAWSVTVLRTSEGSAAALAALGEDITERRIAEDALRLAHANLEATLLALPDLLFVVDAHRRIRDYRAPHRESLYADPQEFLGRDVREIVPADAAAVIAGAIDEAERTGTNYGAVYALELPGGRRWFELSIARSGDAGSPDRTFIALVRDITAQHHAEDGLRASEQLNRALIEGSGASIALFDPQGRILLLNPTAADVIDGEPSDFIGKPMQDVQTVLDRAAFTARLEEVVRTGEPRQYEDPVRLPSGKRWFLSKWQPLRDRDGVLTAVQLIALDITDRRLAEERERALSEKLQQTQKLESLGVLAGGIAHDFNNLLSGILGNADLALLELPATSAARQPLQQVLQGARRAADLTKQMLAYSGRGRFVVETVRLPDLVAEMGKLLEISISKRNVLRYEFAASVPSVEVDVAQIRQVVMNLIINAAEAIGERSGVIALRVGATHCDAARLGEYYLGETLEPGTYVTLEVSDTGAGMSAEVRDRIFEPFFSTKFAGRGLGLAAVLGIIRGHRGGIGIESTPGQGTTFRILLPASRSEAPTGGTRTSGPHGWRGSGTVMVVDDEETVLATSRRMLERMGFTVLAANGGRRALHLLTSTAEPVRAVLLDLTMPDLDGEQTLAEIRRARPQLPVVLCSGYTEHEVMARFTARAPEGFVQKPYGYEALQQAMRRVVEGTSDSPAP